MKIPINVNIINAIIIPNPNPILSEGIFDKSANK